MIKLKYSSSLDYYNNSAVFSDEYVSSSLESVAIDLTSSISTYRGTITGNIFSNKTGYTGGWLLIASSGSNAPTASGHYDANIWEIQEDDITWVSASGIWDQIELTWANYKETTYKKLISTERVFVTGSDYNEEYKYENQELAYYNVYDG